jgi:hypothetical protein
LAESYEAQINELVAEHTNAKKNLQAELEKALALVESTQSESQKEIATLESNFREKVATLEAERQVQAEKHAQLNDDATEKLQNEIETVQKAWNEEQTMKLASLKEDHANALQNLENEHAFAIGTLREQLEATLIESKDLTTQAQVAK